MSFDWERFLQSNNIEFAEHGHGSTRGNLAIHCPFCGADDEGLHMSIATNGAGWRCWRRPQEHYGRSPVALVAQLLGCSIEQARGALGYSTTLPANFLQSVKSILAPAEYQETRDKLEMPAEFTPIRYTKPTARPFINYMLNRGFDRHAIERATDHYDIYYCTSGPFRYRIIFAVYYRNELVTWTGRSIMRDAALRYRALSADPAKAALCGLPRARGPANSFLLWFDDLMEEDADTIVLCEGPFDALKVRVLGEAYGITATCIFTTTPTIDQVEHLHELLPRFKRRVLLLDPGTLPMALRTKSTLASFALEWKQVPKGVEDPGALTRHSFEFLLR